MKTETLAVVNGVNIICFTNTEEKLVPLKPICEALGVDYDIEVSRILNSAMFEDVITEFNNGEWEEHGTKALPLLHALGFTVGLSFDRSSLIDEKRFTQYKFECHQVFINFHKEQL